MEPDAADTKVFMEAVGKPIEVKGTADHSPKTKEGAHPVYKLDVIAKIAGKAAKSTGDAPPISGVVAAIHYAKHGEPNGVVLESGEFLRRRLGGVQKLCRSVDLEVLVHV